MLAVKLDIILRYMIYFVQINQRPKVYFIYIKSLRLTIREKVAVYTTLGSLSRHFIRKCVSKLSDRQFTNCISCNIRLKTRKDLLIHAERFHGTVSRGSAERMIVV